MEDLINKDALKVLVKEAINEQLEKETREMAEGKAIGINEFRKKYCVNRSPEWVRVFIFDEFPEVDSLNGGWVVNPHNGLKTIIFEKRGAEWLEKNIQRIDWTSSFKNIR